MARKRKAPVEVPVPASPSEEEETASGSEEEEVGEGNQSENESGFEAASKESKRSKKEVAQPDNEHADDESRTNLNQRIWSDADEIILLQGVISFNKEKGISYRKLAKNMDLFYNFIKGSLHFDVSITQVKDKLSRLRKKYRKNRGKTSQKPHESRLYDLCKKIWENIADDGACCSNRNVGQSRSKKGKANANLEASKMDAGSGPNQLVGKADLNVLNLAEMEDYVMKRGLEFAKIEDKTQIEEKWKKLHMKSLQLFVEKTDLLSQQAKMALTAYVAGKY